MDESVDPGLAIVAATLGIVALFVPWHLWQRRRAAERRRSFEASARIELPIISEGRRAALSLSTTFIPVAAWVLGFIAFDAAREHAVLLVVGMLGWSACGIILGLTLAERYARSGALALDDRELALRTTNATIVFDLGQRFWLEERESIPMRGPRVIGVTITQRDRQLTFAYPPWGARVVGELPITTSAPPGAHILGAEAAALHARLRAHPSCVHSTEQSQAG